MAVARVVLACAAVICLPVVASAEVSEGKLATRDGKEVIDVPLEHTEVTIRATGHLATVDVEQTFRNPYDHKIEAVYLFPLPTGAAVSSMEMVIGGRVIAGEIARRAEATQIYTRARAAGHAAALLTEERPNLFTQSVANLEPGARLVVRLRYVEPLAYRDGGYEIVFPMVAGPRYVPKSSKQSPDAAAVQPAALPPDTRSSHDIGLTVELDAGVPIAQVESPSHQLVGLPAGTRASHAKLTLAAGDTIPNKDFVLRWQVAGVEPQVAVHAHRDAAAGGAGAFFLTLHPPADVAADEVTPKELVFVVDTSSSMKGQPLAKAKETVRRALGALGADDTFQIVRFADAASALGDRPIAAKPQNVAWALAWLDALQAGGGTEVIEGIAAALDFPHDPARLRIVVFLTDGYVGNEDEILAVVAEKLGESRLFSFGVGSAVNRYLLEEMATIGRGALQVVRPDEDTTAAVERFHARIARPVLTDVTIDWGGLAVADVTPALVPDLFIGQPIVLAGHYARGGAGTITMRGKAAGRDVSFTVAATLPDERHEPAIATVWARARIAELQRALIRRADAGKVEEITQLGLAHHLMTPYTAFVAVDRSRVTAGGEAKRVAVPVEVPAGLAYSEGSSGYGAGIGSRSYGYGGSEMRSEMQPLRISSARAVTPTVSLGSPSRDDETDLRSDIRRGAAGVKACYQTELEANPDLAGRFEVTLTIDASGAVTSVTVGKAPEGAGAMPACMVKALGKLRFGRREEAITITLPFVLRRPEETR